MLTFGAAILAASKKFWILDPLYAVLGNIIAFFYALIPSYGVAIILLTVTVSVLRMPLVAKQVKSQQEMQRIQPELKKIQAKYKNEPQKRNEELMALYKEHSVNPFAGCLPLLLQFPLFIVLYRIILNLAHQPPKHIPVGSSLYKELVAAGGKLHSFGLDLAQRASQVKGTSKIPYLILVLIVVGTGLFQARQMTSRLPKEAQQGNQMAVMGKIMPLFLGLISFSIPAGVVLYFIVSNLWQIGQQYFLFRHQAPGGGVAVGKGGGGRPSADKVDKVDKVDKPDKATPDKAEKPAKPVKPVKKGFMARLAEAANQTPADRSGAPSRPAKAAPKPGARAARAARAKPTRPPARSKPEAAGNGRRASKPDPKDDGKPSANGRTSRPSGRAQPPGSKSRNNRRGK